MLLHLLQLILLTSVSVLALPTAREATDNHVQIVAYSYDSVPDAIPYDQITIINYAFGIPGANDMIEPEAGSFDNLQETVRRAKDKKVKVALSVGGWGGSKTFSDIAANEDRTEVFTQSMVDIYNQYGLDGIDIDWEYPGAPGAEGNAIDLTNDRQNYLRLLRRLRLALPRDALLTAAVSIDTFHVNGSPEMDASDFAAVLDYIYPMVYDQAGEWLNHTAHDAPLSAFVQALNNWLNAGFEARQIILGVPFYGKTFAGAKGAGANQLYKGKVTVDLAFKNQWKALQEPGWIRVWDEKEKSATFYNEKKRLFCTLPDEEFMQYRAKLVNRVKAGGIFFWEMSQDDGTLLSAIHRGSK